MTPQEIEALIVEGLTDKVESLSTMVELLKAERDALATKVKELSAKVDGLTKVNSKLSQIENQQGRINALECALDCLQYEAHLIAGVSEGLDKTLAETLVIHNSCPDEMSSSCLRDIQAEAGWAGYLKGADDWNSFEQVFESDIVDGANEYAESVRQGTA